MRILKGTSIAAFAAACLLVVVTIPLAQNSNNSNKNRDKARKEVVDPIREPDPPEVSKSTDTKKNQEREIADRENKAQRDRDQEAARKNNKKKVVPPSPKP
jgi:hypothetical protein